MKQVVVIHGGHIFESQEEYLSHLQNYKIGSLEYFKRTGWKPSLVKELGEGYEVILPSMPCKENAKYPEWKIWFEKMIPFLEDNVILVGHSLGGKFLARYLAEETFSRKILAVILIASPFDRSSRKHTDFFLPDSLAMFERQGGNIILFHSKDDPVVNFSELAKYQELLPDATVRIFDDRQHFNQAGFPELVAEIKSL